MLRIMLDVSCTLIHHGHIRLINKVKEHFKGQNYQLIIALSSDEYVLRHKGYMPELCFDDRKEIIESIDGICEVVYVDSDITKAIMKNYNIDILVHGHDYVNTGNIESSKLLIMPRTNSISSSDVRSNAFSNFLLIQYLRNNHKLVLKENIDGIIEKKIDTKLLQILISNLKKYTGYDDIFVLPSYLEFGLESLISKFSQDKFLLIGFKNSKYTKFIKSILNRTNQKYDFLEYKDISDKFISEFNKKYDWIISNHIFYDIAFKIDLDLINNLKQKTSAKTILECSWSLGYEEDIFNNADIMICKSNGALLGLKGGLFLIVSPKLKSLFKSWSCYFDYNLWHNYEFIRSILKAMNIKSFLKDNILNEKQNFMKNNKDLLLYELKNQPRFITLIKDNKIINHHNKLITYAKTKT